MSIELKVYERGTFFVKMVYKRVRGWTSGWSLPVLTFVEYPPGRYADRCINFFLKQEQSPCLLILAQTPETFN